MWWLIYILLVLLTLIFFEKYTKDEEFEKLPGPEGILLFGNALSFLMSPVKMYYKLLSFNNKFKDIYKIKLGPKKFAIIMDPGDVEAIISGISNNSKGFIYTFVEPWLKKGLLLNSGPKWQQRRKILTPAFHFKILQHFKVIVDENSRNLVERLKYEADQPKTEIMSYLSDFTLSSICETAMGTKLDPETTDFGKRYKDAINTFAESTVERVQRVWLYSNYIYGLTKTGQQVKKCLQLLTSFRDTIVDKRRQTDDYEKIIAEVTDTDNCLDFIDVKSKKKLAMLDLLLKAEKEGTIDAKGIAEEVDTFIFAGHDTTARALQFTFMLLANHPDWQDKIVDELVSVFGDSNGPVALSDLKQLKYLDVCIKESLRLYPPVYIISRKIEKDVQLKNYKLTCGTDCTIAIYQVHRRPDQFIEPLAFRPERFLTEPTWHPYGYIPFSAGPRNYIGQKFAVMEMKLVLSAVLRQFKLLPVTKPENLNFEMDFLLKTNNTIYVKFEPRK